MSNDHKPAPDWFDRISKLMVPIIAGILVAVVATVGDSMLTDFTSRQENARLITELQIQREQAESDLRKDVFEQAIGALLSNEELQSGSGLSLSKRMLKLEMLAHNFGGSLSLSPLFTEFDRDLEQRERAESGDFDEEVRVKSLRRRLRSLARRLSSDQLSALAQHGALIDNIDVMLKPGGRGFADNPREFKWPDDAARRTLGDPGLYGETYERVVDDEKRALGTVKLDGIERNVTLTLGELDPERMTVNVDLEICWNPDGPKQEYGCEEGDERVRRPFTLDFFNFPKIDNTRLSGNQRFSMVLEEFDTGGDAPGFLEIAAVIFPAEYSSLRERPSMQEAVSLLNSVLRSQEDEQEDNSDGTSAN